MEGELLLRALVMITVLTLALCFFGVGLLILPFLALLWILYFVSNSGVGTAIVLASMVVALGIYLGLRKRPRGGGKHG